MNLYRLLENNVKANINPPLLVTVNLKILCNKLVKNNVSIISKLYWYCDNHTWKQTIRILCIFVLNESLSYKCRNCL